MVNEIYLIPEIHLSASHSKSIQVISMKIKRDAPINLGKTLTDIEFSSSNCEPLTTHNRLV